MDEAQLNTLRRDLQEQKSQLLELSSRVTQLEVVATRQAHLEQRLMAISEMLEQKHQP